MQSVDEFTPSTTEPVFGSGLISQTKAQSSTNNDTSDTEKVNSSSEPVVNGQNDTTVNKVTLNDNVTNGTTENTDATDSVVVHVNGQNEKPVVETNNEVKPAVIEKPNPVEPTIPSTVPQPVDTVQEGSSTIDTAPPAVEPPATITAAAVVNDSAPEAPVATESETTEVKSKTPRGRAKATVAVTPTPTSTRQSARGRKPASSSNAEENQAVDDDTTAAVAPPPPPPPAPTTAIESPQRTKRQTATVAKDAITADSSTVDDVPEQMDVATEGETEKVVTPSAGRKRGAPKSTPNSAKKAKGKNSITPTNDEDDNDDIEAGVKDVEITPKKAARTSANKKPPEPPSEEYARKLRPRK